MKSTCKHTASSQAAQSTCLSPLLSTQMLDSRNRQELAIDMLALSKLRLEPGDQWLDEYFDATEAQLARFTLRVRLAACCRGMAAMLPRVHPTLCVSVSAANSSCLACAHNKRAFLRVWTDVAALRAALSTHRHAPRLISSSTVLRVSYNGESSCQALC